MAQGLVSCGIRPRGSAWGRSTSSRPDAAMASPMAAPGRNRTPKSLAPRTSGNVPLPRTRSPLAASRSLPGYSPDIPRHPGVVSLRPVSHDRFSKPQVHLSASGRSRSLCLPHVGQDGDGGRARRSTRRTRSPIIRPTTSSMSRSSGVFSRPLMMSSAPVVLLGAGSCVIHEPEWYRRAASRRHILSAAQRAAGYWGARSTGSTVVSPSCG